MNLRLEMGHSPASAAVMQGTLALTGDTVAEWCLALTLLKYQMTEHLLIQPMNHGTTLQLRLEPRLMKKYKTSRGRITEQPGLILLALSPQELEVWLVFSLGVYRDGPGGLNHVDFDTSTSGRGLSYDYFGLVLTSFA